MHFFFVAFLTRSVLANDWNISGDWTLGGEGFPCSFDLTVTNETVALENVNVTLIQDSTILTCLTNSSGQVPTQYLTLGNWTLTLTLSNYVNYTSSFTVDSNINWSIALQPIPSGYIDQPNALAYAIVGSMFVGVVVFVLVFTFKRRNDQE